MKNIGMCECGNRGYKIKDKLSICERCDRIEKIRMFPEHNNQTTIDNMSNKIRTEIQAYRTKTIMYLE